MSTATSDTPFVHAPRWSWRNVLARPADSSAVCVAILGIACGVLFFYGLNDAELWRTESLRAILAREMLDSGNWIVPRLYGEPLFTKPPGMYIAIVLCSLPFGEVTEVTARLPSALAATLCVFLFYWYFRRTLGRVAGLAAGLILPTSILWLDKAPSAEIDMLQVLWVAASLLFFFRATEDETTAGPFGWWLAALLCMAGGFLTKWTAPEFFYLTAVPFLWWRGRLRVLFSWQHLTALAIAAGLSLGWVAAAVYLEGWDVLWSTVEREAFSRLVPTYDPKPYPWLESFVHPAKLLAAMLPWSPFALVACRRRFLDLWDERGRRLVQAMHCWAWPHVLFWSFPTEHTPRHSMPLWPGVAGLAALVWFAWYSGKLEWEWPRVRPVKLLAGVLALWLLAKVAFVEVVTPHRNANRQPRAKGALLASLVPVDQILYLFRLKDEGILFYYGRPAVRLHAPEQLPPSGEPVYALLTRREWQNWHSLPHAEVVHRLSDEQGDPLVLVRVLP